MSDYDHSLYVQQDIDRREAANRAAVSQNRLRQYSELYLAVSPDGRTKFAKRVLTRGPLAESAGVWNLSVNDCRVYDALTAAGFQVFLLLHTEYDDSFEQVPYPAFKASAVLKRGKGPGCPDYWQGAGK